MLEPYWDNNYVYNHSHRNQFDYIKQSELASNLAFVNEHSLRISQLDVEHDATVIMRCRAETGRLPVLTLDSNPYDVDTYLDKLEKHIDPNLFFVFNPDIRKEVSSRPNLAPWPSWLINQHLQKNCQINLDKTKRISFLSGVPRYHRILLFKKIKPYIKDNDVVVINTFSKQMYRITMPMVDNCNEKLSWLDELPWANSQEYFDTPQTEVNASNCGSNNHIAYTACINVTGETLGHGSQMLISEKTWKAYRSGCLVVNYGIDGVDQCLAKFGLEVWQDYKQTNKTQIENIVDLFKRDDIENLYQKNFDKIVYNTNLVNGLNFAQYLAQPAIEKLNNFI
jgi:hypothetical protein